MKIYILTIWEQETVARDSAPEINSVHRTLQAAKDRAQLLHDAAMTQLEDKKIPIDWMDGIVTEGDDNYFNYTIYERELTDAIA